MNSATIRWITGQPPKIPRENALCYKVSTRREINLFNKDKLRPTKTVFSWKIPVDRGTDWEELDYAPKKPTTPQPPREIPEKVAESPPRPVRARVVRRL